MKSFLWRYERFRGVIENVERLFLPIARERERFKPAGPPNQGIALGRDGHLEESML